MGRIITDPAVRQKLYAVMTALVPILVGYGLLSPDDAAKFVGLAAAIGGALTTILAAVNTPPAGYTPRHADDGIPDDAGDHLEVIPADQATSDPKSDAAGTL